MKKTLVCLTFGGLLGYFSAMAVLDGCKKEEIILEVNDKNFRREVLDKRLVFVDFYTDWCGICTQARPSIEELAKEYSNRLEFVSYNCEYGNRDERLRLDGYPTFIIFNEGREIGRHSGFSNKERIEDFIQETLGE